MSQKVSQEDYNFITNQISISLAQRESLIKSWTASSSNSLLPAKPEEELDAENSTLFGNKPLYLGIGAPISSDHFTCEAQRNNKTLHARLFGSKSLKARKARDIEEEFDYAKKVLKDDDSDEELGRSSIGKVKKPKLNRHSENTLPIKDLIDTGKIYDQNQNQTLRKDSSQPNNRLERKSDADMIKDKLKCIMNVCEERCHQSSLMPDVNLYESSQHDTLKLDSDILETVDRETKKRMKKREKKKRQKMKARNITTSI